MNDLEDLSQIKAHPQNPRTITPAKIKALKAALGRFGDLGGIVMNRRTKQLVTGHQRMRAFTLSDTAHLEIKTQYQTPSRTGTVAEGVLSLDGERYSYRIVDWDEATHKAASIAANRLAGEWDMSGLTAWLNDLNGQGFDMSLTMFDDAELDKILTPLVPAQPESTPPKEAFDPQTGEVVEFVAHKDGQGRQKDPEGMQVVQIFLSLTNYTRFIECTDALQALYQTENISATIVEAVNRASVSAAMS